MNISKRLHFKNPTPQDTTFFNLNPLIYIYIYINSYMRWSLETLKNSSTDFDGLISFHRIFLHIWVLGESQTWVVDLLLHPNHVFVFVLISIQSLFICFSGHMIYSTSVSIFIICCMPLGFQEVYTIMDVIF